MEGSVLVALVSDVGQVDFAEVWFMTDDHFAHLKVVHVVLKFFFQVKQEAEGRILISKINTYFIVGYTPIMKFLLCMYDPTARQLCPTT